MSRSDKAEISLPADRLLLSIHKIEFTVHNTHLKSPAHLEWTTEKSKKLNRFSLLSFILENRRMKFKKLHTRKIDGYCPDYIDYSDNTDSTVSFRSSLLLTNENRRAKYSTHLLEAAILLCIEWKIELYIVCNGRPRHLTTIQSTQRRVLSTGYNFRLDALHTVTLNELALFAPLFSFRLCEPSIPTSLMNWCIDACEINFVVTFSTLPPSVSLRTTVRWAHSKWFAQILLATDWSWTWNLWSHRKCRVKWKSSSLLIIRRSSNDNPNHRR